MKEALTYMFKDRSFIKKAAIYFIMSLIAQIGFNFVSINQNSVPFPPLLLICVLSILISFVLAGYYFSVIKSIIDGNDDNVIPFINFGKNIVAGLKWFVAVIMFSLCLFIILAVFLISIMAIYKHGFVATAGFLSIPFYVIFVMGLFALFPGLIVIFAKRNEITSLFKIKEAFNSLCANAKEYFTGYIMYIILAALIYLIYGFMYDISIIYKDVISVNPQILTYSSTLLNSIITSYFVFVYQ